MLYIHIPYCHQKCTYCAFYSLPTRQSRQPYIDALCLELALRRSEHHHPIRTIYFGGGTPSILAINQLQQIITTLQRHYDTSALQEATLEANPEDLTPSTLSQLADLKFFNRLSIGIQSFNNSDLRMLNRHHTGDQAISAVLAAHQAGFRNISIDLIYGLPSQSESDWADNLAQLTLIEPYINHLSCYALTLEPGTMLHKQIASGAIPPIDDEMAIRHYQALQQWIHKHSWHQYEISSYCRPGCHSVHNSRYWDSTPYLGAGAGAHSFDGSHRRWNICDIDTYIYGVLHSELYWEQESLTTTDRINEYIMTALRTTSGISLSHIHSHFSWAECSLMEKAQRYLGSHLIIDNEHLRPTQQGLLYADGIAADLFFE